MSRAKAPVVWLRVCGELDNETRNRLVVMCVAGSEPAVIVDLTALTIMDCAGYGAIVAVRQVLEHGARSLTIRNQTGQPARLLEMIAALERSGAIGVCCIHREFLRPPLIASPRHLDEDGDRHRGTDEAGRR